MPPARAVVADIRGAGGDAIYLHQDVTDEARWPQVIGAVEKRFGRLDVMVANAGIAIRVPIVDMTLADWRRQQAVNLEGVFLSVKHAVPAMRRAGGGSIIIMSSLAGLRGAPGLGGYCATKGGVRLFAKAAAIEHAADNIRVNSVHPGIIDTDIWRKMVAGADAVPAQRADRRPCAVARVRAAVASGRGAGHRRRRALPRIGGLGLHDGGRAGDRRGHVRRRDAAASMGKSERRRIEAA